MWIVDYYFGEENMYYKCLKLNPYPANVDNMASSYQC